MDAKSFYEKHGEEACARVADRAGTKWAYFKQFVSGHRRPSPDLATQLVRASQEEYPGAVDEQLDFTSLLPPKKRQEREAA